jgi:hypothetical protein
MRSPLLIDSLTSPPDLGRVESTLRTTFEQLTCERMNAGLLPTFDASRDLCIMTSGDGTAYAFLTKPQLAVNGYNHRLLRTY